MGSIQRTVGSHSCRAGFVLVVALVVGGAVMASAQGYQGPKEKLHVYLLTGGTVMSGEAKSGTDDDEVLARCYLLNAEGKWEPAQGALNRFSSFRDAKKVQKLGPARSFAKAMLAANKDISLGLVVNAGEGKDFLPENWNYKSDLYRATRKRAADACKTGTFKGVLWYQDQIREGPVLSNLKDLIASLRGDFAALNLPVVVGGMINPGEPVVAMDSVNQALLADVHAVGYARLEIAKTNAPQTDAALMERLGIRYAEEMLKVQAQSEIRRQSRKPSDIPFIDAHIHASHTAVNGLDIVSQWMDKNHVVRCISKTLDPTRDKTESQRQTMLGNFQKYKGKIERFCIIYPEEVKSVEEAVAILKKEKAEGAIGFGEHYGVSRMFDDPANLRLYAACEQVGMPVHFHIDANKNMDERGLPRLERVLKMFPTCILIAHAEFWLELSNGTCERLLQTYPNLYAETSGHRMAIELNRDRTYSRKFLERNADKILFGSDEGWWSFGKNGRAIQFELFEELDLSDEVRAKIYHKNAERVFGFER